MIPAVNMWALFTNEAFRQHLQSAEFGDGSWDYRQGYGPYRAGESPDTAERASVRVRVHAWSDAGAAMVCDPGRGNLVPAAGIDGFVAVQGEPDGDVTYQLQQIGHTLAEIAAAATEN